MKIRVSAWVVLILGLLTTVALIAPPAMGESDETLTIKTMRVSLWPEYDDPRVLVMYQGEFYNEAIFPQPVAFPVPLGSEMNQVCALQPPDNSHLCQLYETLTESDSLSISYTLPIPTYYLEYYWDGITGQPEKSFAFQYVSPYAIDTLEIEVQQPLKATGFELVPQYASATSDSQGLKYFHYVFKDVKPGQVINIDASYFKSDDRPSVSGSQIGGAGGSNSYIWIGIGAAIVVVVAAGFILFTRKSAVSRTQSRRAARIEANRSGARTTQRPAAPGPSLPAPGTEVLFCSHCGTKLAVEAAFCQLCGAKVKGIS